MYVWANFPKMSWLVIIEPIMFHKNTKNQLNTLNVVITAYTSLFCEKNILIYFHPESFTMSLDISCNLFYLVLSYKEMPGYATLNNQKTDYYE